MKNKLFLIGICILLQVGCATTIKIYPVQMGPKLKYHGFSIERPIYNNWYLRPEQQTIRKALFYRDHKNDTYSVYFVVLLDTLKGDLDSYVKFYNKKYLSVNDSVRFILKESKIEKIQTEETYKYYARTIDKGSYNARGKELLLVSFGFIKRHPNLPNKVLITQFSERGTEEDFKSSCESESKHFFDSVEFDAK